MTAVASKAGGAPHGYPTYRESGIEWLGPIPEHWNARRLKYVAPLRDRSDSSVPGGDGYVGLERVEARTGRLIPAKYGEEPEMDPEPTEGSVFRSGDVLFGKLRPYLAKVLVPSFDGYCSSEFMVFRSNGEILPRLLFYQLLSSEFTSWVNASTYGTKMPRADPEEVVSLAVALPPPEEQGRIVDFLDRETAKIDALIAKKERLIELLREKRAELITKAVTKGLHSDVAVKETGIGWLPHVPRHWRVASNAALFRERDTRGEGDLPILEVSIRTGVALRQFSESRIETRAADSMTYKVARKDDLAFNKMRMWQGAVGAAPQDGLVSSDYVVAEPSADASSSYFALLFRTSNYMTEVYRYSHGIADDRNRLYWEDFKALKSPVPPRAEQDRIVRHIESEAAKIDRLVAAVRRAVAALTELRIALISAAVTGKVDVRSDVAAA